MRFSISALFPVLYIRFDSYDIQLECQYGVITILNCLYRSKQVLASSCRFNKKAEFH